MSTNLTSFEGYGQMTANYRFRFNVVWAISSVLARLAWTGRENIPAQGGCLIVSNHISFLDPTTIGLAVGREMWFLGRSSLFKPPIMDKLLPGCHVMPIDRGSADLKGMRAIINKLKEGGIVLLFPEGTRSKDGELQAAQPGAAMIACKAQKPIVPARLWGTRESWPRERKYPKLGGRWHVALGKPFMPPSGARFRKDDYETLAARMMSEIGKLACEP